MLSQPQNPEFRNNSRNSCHISYGTCRKKTYFGYAVRIGSNQPYQQLRLGMILELSKSAVQV